jgi:formylglycine-generating enzyme required for sulfatase activity
MISVPHTRITIGLTPDEADRLALELAKMEHELHEPGLGAFDVVDVEAVAKRRRAWLEAAMPAHEVEVGPFEIDVYPVTNAQWSSYMKAARAAKPETWPLTDGKRFVSGVSWREAEAYATHHELALPTEAEWECAARRDRSLFTWGDSYFPQGEVAFKDPVDEPYAVGSRPQLASARGVHDLLGQFGEYCADWFGPYPGADPATWSKLFPTTQGQRTVRGGYDLNQDATCVSRRGVPETERRTHLKFRCVRRT